VGSGVETVFLDMVKEIVGAVGQGEIQYVPFPDLRDKIDIKRFVVTYQKIQDAVSWAPQVDLATGIRRTFEFYDQNLHYYLRNGKKPA
jgi:dTDP-D-glucose 4,6-dehydratase